MSNNQLRYIAIAGLFFVPFIPLFVAKSLFFPFITGKAFAFRFLVEIMFAAWAALAIRDETYRPKFSWVMVSVMAFLVVMGIADILSANPFKSFWSNYERMEGFVSLLHFAAYFVVAGSLLKTQSIWNKLLATSLGASAIMAIYSFLQLAGKITINQGGVRVDGTFGNASYLGIYMVFHIFFAALLLLRFNQNWQRIVLGVIALMDLVVLYFTATRGAILGLLGGALITLIYLAIKADKGASIRKVATTSIIALLLLVGAFFAFKNTHFVQKSPVLSRFATLSVSDLETQGRFYVWPMAWKGFLEKPILGWGQESFNFVFNKYYDARMYTQEPWFDRTHNIVLDWLIAGGAIGLLAYLSMFGAMLYYIWKAGNDFLPKQDKAVILGLLAAYVFHNLFVFDQIGSYILFFTLLGYVHSHTPEVATSLWGKASIKLRALFEKDGYEAIFESSIAILLVLVMYFVNYVPWKENKNLLAVLSSGNQSQTATLEVYKRPLASYNMGFPESLEHVSNAAISLAFNPNADQKLKDSLFAELDKDFQIQIAKVPDDARYRLFYGLFLSRYGWYGRALEQLQQASELSPNKQTIYFEMVNNMLLNGKTLEALATAKKAYDLEPNFTEAKLIYGLTALASGDTALSNKLLGEIDRKALIFDDRYLTILVNLHKYPEVIAVIKERIEKDPGNLQHHITLTAAYLQAGRRGEAIQTLQEMIVLDPSFKEKGDYYINEIKAGRNP